MIWQNPSVREMPIRRQLGSKPLPCPLPLLLLGKLTLSLAYSKIALCSKTLSSPSRLISATLVV